MTRAGELISAGAIGRVLQTAALAPHRLNAESRPSWFFERERADGILCDLATHSIDEFPFFTGSTDATVVAAQAGNINHPEFPKIEAAMSCFAVIVAPVTHASIGLRRAACACSAMGG